MTLTEHINDIQEKLRNGEYPNEAAVSRGIVSRLLDALEWPVYNTQIVFPEYSVESRRVDFALCHPPAKPVAFIEVKQVGNIGGAERQLFEYAFHAGVPIAVLTDGQKWIFFHPIGEGDYKERKVYEMDILKDSAENSAERLNRYLNYNAIKTREAAQSIKTDHRKRQIDRYLPKAWDELTEGLFDRVGKKTEELSQYKPTHEEILAFVKDLDGKTEPQPPDPKPQPHPKPRRGRTLTTIVVTMLSTGEKINEKRGAATDAFVETIEKLGIERVENLGMRAYNNPLVSTAKPSNANNLQVGPYYIVTHSSTKAKKRILERIAESLSEDIEVEIVPRA